jgi:hypothetical protein
MFLFYVLRFFKKGDTIQGGTLFKEIQYSEYQKVSIKITFIAVMPECEKTLGVPVYSYRWGF